MGEMRPDIILIGPMRAGKSTVGPLLAERLGQPLCSLDEIGWTYYREAGFDPAAEQRIRATAGVAGSVRYWAPFNLYAVERALVEHRGAVFDFGAGHSVYDDPAHLARAQQLLAPYPNVVLVLPSPDADESIRVLRRRLAQPSDDDFDLTAYAVNHPANRLLARLVVYTQGKTPAATCDEILDRLPNR